MAGPYKCVNMLVKVAGNSVGVVEGFDIELSFDGGVEPVYGTRLGVHAVGGKKATFSIRRWYQSDSVGGLALLWDLFQNELPFLLSGELIDNNGISIANTQISLSNCRIYRYHPRTGGANDIVAEEASGEAVTWASTIP